MFISAAWPATCGCSASTRCTATTTTTPKLAQVAHAESRILLTRDLGLLKRGLVEHGYFVRATDPLQQVDELVGRFALRPLIAPFQRCSRCNGLVAPVAKAAVLAQLPPQVQAQHDEFHQCAGCGQVYWQGSHIARIQEFIGAIGRDDGAEQPG